MFGKNLNSFYNCRRPTHTCNNHIIYAISFHDHLLNAESLIVYIVSNAYSQYLSKFVSKHIAVLMLKKTYSSMIINNTIIIVFENTIIVFEAIF